MTRAPAAEIADQVTASDVALYREYAAQGIRMFPADTLRLLTALDAATARAEKAEEKLHYATGVGDLAMKHRDAAETEAARLREEASAYRDRADKVHDQMVNMLHNLKKGMEAPTGSRLEAFLDEWTDLLEGAAPTPPAVATPAPTISQRCPVCGAPADVDCDSRCDMANGIAEATVAPEGPSEALDLDTIEGGLKALWAIREYDGNRCVPKADAAAEALVRLIDKRIADRLAGRGRA